MPGEQHDFTCTFLGLIGFADPLRPAVPAAIQDCHAAGIRVLMITGDYPGTARSIARQAGLVLLDEPLEDVLTGPDLECLDEPTLQRRLKSLRISARVVPAHKLRIVNALKRGGDIVAMTGDGVNDAPALKAAHIGVAMGGTFRTSHRSGGQAGRRQLPHGLPAAVSPEAFVAEAGRGISKPLRGEKRASARPSTRPCLTISSSMRLTVPRLVARPVPLYSRS